MEQEKDKEMWEEEKKEANVAKRGGYVGKGVGVDGIGKMRGKREGETDILEKGQAMRARFC